MRNLSVRKISIILAHAVVGWALCTATIGIGLAVTTLQPTLIAHAIGAPIYFFGVSMVAGVRMCCCLDCCWGAGWMRLV